MFTINDFLKGIQVYAEIEKTNEKLKIFKSYKFDGRENRKLVLEVSLKELEEIESEFQKVKDGSDTLKWDEGVLWDKTTFEAAVDVESQSSRFYFSSISNERYTADEHGLKFCVSAASKKYIYALLCNCGNCESDDYDLNLTIRVDSEISSSLEEFFSRFRIHTVKLNSKEILTKKEFNRLIHSYLFNISYNYDVILFIKKSFKRELRYRKRTRSGQMFPYKAYKQELTKYYSQAIAVDIPFTQYLAFYHVAEYFFQIISEQNAFDEIEQFITRPSFSPYKKEDIKQFYNKIKKKMREQSEDGVWNEKTALLLSLKEYVVDIENLKNAIHSIDESAIEYYKNSDVNFADGSKKIDFDESDDHVYLAIRDRVYSVRNAIVHSKEGDKLRYEPFKHDKQLAKEIPLIRSIAEEIIINSADSIKF
ncbi:hypothetical protein GH811_13945 [Acetobacterium malicum]|uniref:Apea-like HEPN domain-containing protein n=1 Tax=Acetobacterium malicum TaxID=52692 RepID=A0ABR6YZV9_9FIRM|nr:hypothetical protein [Acetobacterium malicum]MBC3900718.1 hypothetical protein [Acetobacterium malicum]